MTSPIDKSISRWCRPAMQKAIDAAWYVTQSSPPGAPLLPARRRTATLSAVAGSLTRYALGLAASVAGREEWALSPQTLREVRRILRANGVQFPWEVSTMPARRTTRRPKPAGVDPLATLAAKVGAPPANGAVATLPAAVPELPRSMPPPPAPESPSPVPAPTTDLEVYTNIKGGRRVKVGRCTAFVAPSNRSHKTLFLDAIRLAVRGKHEIGTSTDALLALADGKELIAGLADGPNIVAHYQIDAERKAAHQLGGAFAALTAEEVDRVFPLSSVDDLMRFGTPLAREEFLRRFGGQGVSLDPPKGLDEQQIQAWHQALVAVGAEKEQGGLYTRTTMDSVDALTELPGHFRRQKLNLGKQIAAHQEAADRSRQEILASAGGALVDDAAVEAARQKWVAAEAYEKAGQTRRVIELKRAEYARLYDESQKLLAEPTPPEPEGPSAEMQQRVEQAERDVQVAAAEVGAIHLAVQGRHLLVQSAAQGGGVCIFCGGSPGLDPRSLLASAEQRLAVVQQAHEARAQALREARTELATAMQDQKVQAAERAVSIQRRTEVVDRLNALRHEVQGLESTLTALGAATDPGITNIAAKEHHDILARARSGLRALDEDAARIRQIETARDGTKLLEKIASEVLTTASLLVARNAEEAVRPYLPPGFEARLVLVEDGKRTYRWDVVGTDGQPHRLGAMSGAEKAALRVALALAWSEGLPVRIVLLDDSDLAGFSADGVRAFLDKIRECVESGKLTQAFCAWSRPSEVGPGWSIVRVDE